MLGQFCVGVGAKETRLRNEGIPTFKKWGEFSPPQKNLAIEPM